MSFLGSLMSINRPNKSSLVESHRVIQQVVSTLGYDVRKTRDYEQRLIPALNSAATHFDQQVAVIPGSLHLSASTYSLDPVLAALFPTAEDIGFAIGRSIETQQSLMNLASAGHPQLYGLMGMRCRPDEQVAGRPPVFADHTLKCIAASEEKARLDIRDAALYRLIVSYDEHIDKLQKKGKLLKQEWHIEKHGKHVNDGEEFVYAGKELLPENMLRGLISWLEEPDEHLRVVGPAAGAGGQGISSVRTVSDFPVLHCADRRQWIVSIVKFPTSEGVEALRQEKRIHRYIFI
jgi:hypothetical protein